MQRWPKFCIWTGRTLQVSSSGWRFTQKASASSETWVFMVDSISNSLLYPLADLCAPKSIEISSASLSPECSNCVSIWTVSPAIPAWCFCPSTNHIAHQRLWEWEEGPDTKTNTQPSFNTLKSAYRVSVTSEVNNDKMIPKN